MSMQQKSFSRIDFFKNESRVILTWKYPINDPRALINDPRAFIRLTTGHTEARLLQDSKRHFRHRPAGGLVHLALDVRAVIAVVVVAGADGSDGTEPFNVSGETRIS